MPNLNVKGESPKPSSGPAPGGGGGGSKLIITIIIVIVVLAGGAFILNTTGVVKLWGKKKAQPVVMNLPMETPPAEIESAPETSTPPPAEENPAVAENLTKLEVNAKLGAGKQPQKMIVTGTGMYTIQISSWSSSELANKHAKMFADAGFETFVDQRGSYYRVCIGRYETKKAAREQSDKMEHMLESMPVISTVGN
jgi:cell division septation protein DedD